MNAIIFKVEGMMCTGCENRIKNVLKEIDGVEEVIANHNNGTVEITLSKDVQRSLLKEKIEEIDFKVME